MRCFVVSACLVCAPAAFGLALWTYAEVSMFGFPDGYVTDYQKAAEAPLTVIAWMAVALGLLFSILAFRPRDIGVRTGAACAALVALLVVAAAAVIGVPWYFGTHLGLDTGIGG